MRSWFFVQSMEDTIKLNTHLLNTESPFSSLDTSINELILIKLNSQEFPEALKLSHEFKCNEKRWIWLQVRSFCASLSWKAVHTLVGEYKRLPIGWVPFLLYVSHYQVPVQYIREWIPKATVDWRCRLYETFSLWHDAFEASKVTGETEDLLTRLARKMDHRETSQEMKLHLQEAQSLCAQWIASKNR
jgi:hypothetical protein